MDTCVRCGARVWVVRCDTPGQRLFLDPEPAPEGTVRVMQVGPIEPLAVPLGRHIPSGRGYRLHTETCQPPPDLLDVLDQHLPPEEAP